MLLMEDERRDHWGWTGGSVGGSSSCDVCSAGRRGARQQGAGLRWGSPRTDATAPPLNPFKIPIAISRLVLLHVPSSPHSCPASPVRGARWPSMQHSAFSARPVRFSRDGGSINSGREDHPRADVAMYLCTSPAFTRLVQDAPIFSRIASSSLNRHGWLYYKD